MEIWDLYTKDKELTGKTMIRGEATPKGYYSLGVTVWTRNRKGQYLISQRAASKATYPLKWEPVGGGVIAGETSLEGAMRELWEEVGIKADPEKMQLLFTHKDYEWNGRISQEINDIYLYEIDDYDANNAVSDEVAQSKWLYPEEIKEMLDSGEFIELYSYFFDKIDR